MDNVHFSIQMSQNHVPDVQENIQKYHPRFAPDRVLIWTQLQKLQDFDPEEGMVLEVPASFASDLYQEIHKKYSHQFQIDTVETSQKVTFIIYDLVRWAVDTIIAADYRITLDVGSTGNAFAILKKLNVWVDKHQEKFMGSVILSLNGKSTR